MDVPGDHGSGPVAAMLDAKHPVPGDLVAGKYRVESVLGKGGMGVVVSAVHQLFGERVAPFVRQQR